MKYLVLINFIFSSFAMADVGSISLNGGESIFATVEGEKTRISCEGTQQQRAPTRYRCIISGMGDSGWRGSLMVAKEAAKQACFEKVDRIPKANQQGQATFCYLEPSCEQR